MRYLAAQSSYVTWVTVAECYEGAFRSVNLPARLMDYRLFLAAHPSLQPTDPILERFGELRAQIRRQGQAVPDFDLMIAATTLHHNLTLLTFNRRHFARVPHLRLYQPT